MVNVTLACSGYEIPRLACSGKDCPLRMRCSLYDNFIYYAMKCEDTEFVIPAYDEELDYCEYLLIEEA